jgi:hypothetical protein
MVGGDSLFVKQWVNTNIWTFAPNVPRLLGRSFSNETIVTMGLGINQISTMVGLSHKVRGAEEANKWFLRLGIL